MKSECSIIRDLLPLYIENMVSENTANFVGNHLNHCLKCKEEYETMIKEIASEKENNALHFQNDLEAVQSIRKMRKKIQKRVNRTAIVLALIIIVICTLLYHFPIYRTLNLLYTTDFYNKDQIKKALYIGDKSDRRAAETVLSVADKAFYDVNHKITENENRYGLLARYSTDDTYGDVSYNEHSLKLWSAHLEDKEGLIWVFYSSRTFNHDGSIACASKNVPALWKVEKNARDEWIVVEIIEHP